MKLKNLFYLIKTKTEKYTIARVFQNGKTFFTGIRLDFFFSLVVFNGF